MIIYLSSRKKSSYANPSVSVIIPMYNAAKYIGECLDSVFMQTYQDFEIIVVDDCSTDDSVKIVRSYVQKFDGRIKISSTEKNSGSGGKARNIGLTLASGEYVYFLDADDFILLTALETLYAAAKEYDADVVYTGTFYNLNQPNEIQTIIDREGIELLKRGLEDKPNLTIGSNDKILRCALTNYNFRAPWLKFLRRDFLLKNKINFPEINIGEDILWTINVCIHSERFLRLSQSMCFYRAYNESSVTNKKRVAQKQAFYWLSGFIVWLKAFNELINEIKFLRENPDLCYRVLRDYLDFTIKHADGAQGDLQAQDLYKYLCATFVLEKNLPHLTMPFFLSVTYEYINSTYKYKKNFLKLQKQLKNQEQFDKFKIHFTARIDIKLSSIEGDFQIFSVSDEKAEVTKPSWFQNNGIGYVITSFAGKLNFKAKTTVDGKINFNLRGMDIRSNEDWKNNITKRIPYWIDYTHFVINGKEVFNSLIPAWCDKPYNYIINVKASEEITVQIEWLPHRSDI